MFIFCHVTYKLVENFKNPFKYGLHFNNIIFAFVVFSFKIVLGLIQLFLYCNAAIPAFIR